MNKAETKHIDVSLDPMSAPEYTLDHLLALRLTELLKAPGSKFVLVEKFGVHAPYESALPKDAKVAPVDDDIVGVRLPEKFKSQVDNYVAGVTLQVDKFFETLLPAIEATDTLVIYTSDHGQSLFQGGYAGTHCTHPKSHHGEGIVPLFALSTRNEFSNALRSSAIRGLPASHFNIFPTLLTAMAYDRQEVNDRYGSDLTGIKETAARGFYSGSVFGHGAKWNQVPAQATSVESLSEEAKALKQKRSVNLNPF